MLTSFIVRESHEFATVDFSGDSFRSYAQKNQPLQNWSSCHSVS